MNIECSDIAYVLLVPTTPVNENVWKKTLKQNKGKDKKKILLFENRKQI